MVAFLSLRRKAIHLCLAAVAMVTLAACDVPTVGGGGGPLINTSRAVPVALLVPGGEVVSGDDLDHHLPEGPVVVYCKAGPRAQRAAAHLVRLGREDVSVMSGGILGWIEQVDPSLPSY